MSLQLKITGFTLATAIIPLAITGTLIYNKVSDSLENIVRKTVTAQASEELLTVQQALMDAKHQLMTLGTLSTMQQVKNFQTDDSIQFDLEQFAKSNPTFLELAVTDDQGIAIASTVPSMRFTSLDSTWEYEAPRLGIVFDGPVVQSIRLDNIIATQSLPIFDNESAETVIGTLIGSIDWASMQSMLANRTLFGNEQDSNGQFILKSIRDDKIIYAPRESNFKPEELINPDGAGEFYKIQRDGREFVVAVADSKPMNGFRDPQWRMYVLVDAASAYSMVSSTQRYILYAALATIFLITVLGAFFAKSLVYPVKSLLLGAERIASGEYDQPIESQSRDEIGQLARSFESMRGSIKDKQRELVRKSEVAEQAAQTKGEFLANMSHEVRTPINGVLGMTELLLNTELNATQHRYASTISRSGQSLLSVINDILDFSKIEAGKLSLYNSPFDLRDLVEDITELLAESAHRQGVELNLLFPPDSHTAFSGDASRLRQVLFNLIGNAIKFTEGGEVTVRVSEEDKNEEHSVLTFHVSDTGVGISEEAQSRIFDSFVQADGSTTRQFGGTGLGLSISAQLVQLMGGEISVKSQVGKGSTFSFTADVEKLPESHNARWNNIQCLENACIAVIDDNPTNVEILKSHIEHWGATAVCAASPISGLKLIEKKCREGENPDIILLDMNMPKLNGLEVAAALKSNPITAGSQLVLLSSMCDQMDRKICKEVGINVLLTKPVKQGELFRCIASMTSGVDFEELNDSFAPEPTKIATNLSGTVLLAEDNPVNQDMMQELLKIMGVKSVLAENGQQALDAIQSGQEFDLVLMDCQMPVLDGFESTRAIRAFEAESESARIPIVALTANAMQGDRERCIDAGMDEYLSKPVSSDTLKRMLANWLQTVTPINNQPSEVTDPQSTAPDNLRACEVIRSNPNLEMDSHTNLKSDANENKTNVMALSETVTNATANKLAEFSQLPILDDAVYGEVCGMCAQASEGFYERLYDKYTQSAVSDLADIEVAIKANDSATVSASAHRLKSGTANWGGKRMAAHCQELESNAKADNLTDAAVLLAHIQSEYDVLLAQLLGRDKAA